MKLIAGYIQGAMHLCFGAPCYARRIYGCFTVQQSRNMSECYQGSLEIEEPKCGIRKKIRINGNKFKYSYLYGNSIYFLYIF